MKSENLSESEVYRFGKVIGAICSAFAGVIAVFALPNAKGEGNGINPHETPAAYASESGSGSKKECLNDPGIGRETTSTDDGVRTVRERFATGRLVGQPRSLISTKDGIAIRSEEWSYDDLGRLSRNTVRTEGKEILRTFAYDKNGKVERKFRNGNLVEVNLYGIDGLLKTGLYADGKIIDYAKRDGLVRPVETTAMRSKPIDLEQELSTLKPRDARLVKTDEEDPKKGRESEDNASK